MKVKENNCHTLYLRPKWEHLVLGTSFNDRGWKGKFVLIKKASLGNVGDYLLDDWDSSDVVLKALIADLGVEAQTLKFLQLMAGQRTFNRHAPIVVEDDEGVMALRRLVDLIRPL